MPFGFRELRASLGPHTTAAGPDVLARGGQAGLRADQGVREGFPGGAGQVVLAAHRGQSFVEFVLGLGEPAGRAHGIVTAGRHVLGDGAKYGPHARGGTRQLGAGALLHEPLGLGHITLGNADGVLEGFLRPVQVPLRMLHRCHETLGLTHGLLGGADAQYGPGQVVGLQGSMSLRDGRAGEFETIARLLAVVAHGCQGGVVVVGGQRHEKFLGLAEARLRLA